MASGGIELVQLRRHDTSQQWGFRMQGGREFGLPLFILQVNPKGLSYKLGLRPGDAIRQIGPTCVNGFSHQEAKNELMRAGNEVDLYVERNAINTKDPEIRAACQLGPPGAKRVELDEGSINPHMNEGSQFRNVTPKSYQILEKQLGGAGPAPSALGGNRQPPQQMQAVHAQPAPAGGKPSSIFDRKKQDRSDYLVASEQTIQKSFGES